MKIWYNLLCSINFINLSPLLGLKKEVIYMRKQTKQNVRRRTKQNVRRRTNNIIEKRKEMCESSSEDEGPDVELLSKILILFKKSDQKITSLEKSISEIRLLTEPKSKSNYELLLERSNSIPYAFIAVIFLIMMYGLMIIYFNTKFNSLETTVRKELYDEIKEQVLVDLAPKVTSDKKTQLKTQLNHLANIFKQEETINMIKKSSTTIRSNVSSTMQLNKLANDFQQEKVLNMINNNSSTTTESETNTNNNTVMDELRSKKTVIINSRQLFLYEKSCNESKIIATIPKGSKITFLEEESNGWLKVEFNGKKGNIPYLHTNYTAKFKKPLISKKTFKKYQLGYIEAVNVNLRKNPNTVSTILDTVSYKTLKINKHFKYFEKEPHGWYKATDLESGKTVYVYAEFVRLIDSLVTNNKKTTDTQKETSTINNKTSSQNTDIETSTTNNLNKTRNKGKINEVESNKSTNSKKISSKKTSSKKTSSKKTSSKKTSSKKTSSKKTTNFIEATEENIHLLALVLTQEAGGCGKAEMRRVGQVLLNRANINKMDLVSLLSAPNQYPTTWAYIQAGKVTPTEKALEVAKELLIDEKNGFEGTGLAKSLWNYVYFQGCNNGIEVFTSKWHRYAIRSCDAYLLDNK